MSVVLGLYRRLVRNTAGQVVNRTQKNILMMDFIIRHHTQPGRLVVSLFDGVGTTSIAALRHGRSVMAFEIDVVAQQAGKARVSAFFVSEAKLTAGHTEMVDPARARQQLERMPVEADSDLEADSDSDS